MPPVDPPPSKNANILSSVVRPLTLNEPRDLGPSVAVAVFALLFCAGYVFNRGAVVPESRSPDRRRQHFHPHLLLVTLDVEELSRRRDQQLQIPLLLIPRNPQSGVLYPSFFATPCFSSFPFRVEKEDAIEAEGPVGLPKGYRHDVPGAHKKERVTFVLSVTRNG